MSDIGQGPAGVAQDVDERSTAGLQEHDRRIIHPWDDLARTEDARTIIGRGDGVYICDGDGNRLLDAPGGMWCVNAGHGRAEIIDAISEQLTRLSYCSPWALANEPAARLAKELVAVSPGDLNHVFFTTGGSTAVDTALRFVMFYNNALGRPDKKLILSRERAYHGSTYLAAACSGPERGGSLLDSAPGVAHRLSAPDPSRRPSGTSVEEFCDGLVAELEETIASIGPERIAAFIAEPIMAAGGVLVPPEGYLRRCREVCRRHQILYISDEVVTAFGRLGHWFASEDVFGIVPDLITTAKGITSGYQPLGAVLISERLIHDLTEAGLESAVFANGFTYSGHPVACAAALANIEVFRRERLLEHARAIAPYFQKKLRGLLDMPIVGDVRGMGLMACVECTLDGGMEESLLRDLRIGSRIDAHCQSMGLLVRPIINMCVMSPPLTITRDQIDELVTILGRGIELATGDLAAEGLL